MSYLFAADFDYEENGQYHQNDGQEDYRSGQYYVEFLPCVMSFVIEFLIICQILLLWIC